MCRQIILSWHIVLINCSFSAAFAARFISFTRILRIYRACTLARIHMRTTNRRQNYKKNDICKRICQILQNILILQRFCMFIKLMMNMFHFSIEIGILSFRIFLEKEAHRDLKMVFGCKYVSNSNNIPTNMLLIITI